MKIQKNLRFSIRRPEILVISLSTVMSLRRLEILDYDFWRKIQKIQKIMKIMQEIVQYSFGCNFFVSRPFPLIFGYVGHREVLQRYLDFADVDLYQNWCWDHGLTHQQIQIVSLITFLFLSYFHYLFSHTVLESRYTKSVMNFAVNQRTPFAVMDGAVIVISDGLERLQLAREWPENRSSRSTCSKKDSDLRKTWKLRLQRPVFV